MKKFTLSVLLVILSLFTIPTSAQNTDIAAVDDGVGYTLGKYDANNPEITAGQYAVLDKRCAENLKLLGLDKVEKSATTVSLVEWPVRAAAGLTDCSYYIVTAYVDENLSAGAIGDYNCGTNTYDTHQGTDICTWPFPFYKMDHSQVEVVAAAPGTILDKDDGNFDRNCSSNALPANYVIIQHADGSCALYWHMKSGSVTSKAIGQTVVAGEYLGAVGSSGSSTGPHLHFEVWTGTSSATYNDPYYGTCNVLNGSSWWASQKPYTEPAILKASVHTTDAVIPGCDTTETPNESTSYTIPFQGQGLPPGYAKFYIFMRDEVSGTIASLSILNPGGSTFASWPFNCNNNYNGLYWCWSKLLPTIAGTYTFQATYNGITCSQDFDIITTTGVPTISETGQLQIFPNPSYGNFILEIGNEGATIEIFNILGGKIYTAKQQQGNLTIDLSDEPCGIYFLNIKTANKIETQKIIIQK
jgi:murein DD-endopeptidase MepM/ murein hydrolase activator NlpD